MHQKSFLDSIKFIVSVVYEFFADCSSRLKFCLLLEAPRSLWPFKLNLSDIKVTRSKAGRCEWLLIVFRSNYSGAKYVYTH